MSGRIFVVGDIHGRLSALNEVLDASGFRNDKDRLITLGDVCDGGSQTKGVIDRLLEVKDRVDIIGNHDFWFSEWVNSEFGYFPEHAHWESQGGLWTERSYGFDHTLVPRSHRKFLEKQVPYYVDEKNRIFVHGGFNPKIPVGLQPIHDLFWDRTLLKHAKYRKVPGYTHVFAGHTSSQSSREKRTTIIDGKPVINYHRIVYPKTWNNLTLCDCGGGYTGRLALVNVEDPLEYWLSQFQVPNYEPYDRCETFIFDGVSSDGSDDTEEFAWGKDLPMPAFKKN